MRILPAVTAIALLVGNQSAIACTRDDPAKVTEVRFVHKAAAGAAAKSVDRQGRRDAGYAVTVDIMTGGRYEPGLVLVTSMDMIIAPRHLPALDVPGKDIEKEVGWGVLANEENLRAVVLKDFHACAHISVVTFEVALDRIVAEHFADEDGLWPWVVRVQAMIIDRDGSVVARGEGKLRNPWRVETPGNE